MGAETRIREHWPNVPSHVPPGLVRPVDFWNGLGDRPQEALAKLHDGPRIVYTPYPLYPDGSPGAWVLNKAADIRATLRDAENFSSAGRTATAEAIGESWSLIPLEYDPPDHQKYRTLVNQLFGPKMASVLGPKMAQKAIFYVDKCIALKEFDFVRDFGRLFPAAVFLDLFGLPQDNIGLFLDWERTILEPDSRPEERLAALRESSAFLRGLIAERRRRPGDDFVSNVISARVDGVVLDDDEALGVCWLMFSAGLDTVGTSMGFQFRHLAETPSDQAALRADPSRIPAAIEELLAAYAAVNVTRIAARDVDIDGVTIKKGETVICPLSLGARDPDEVQDPGKIDIFRVPRRQVAFGFGPHLCVGAALARREIATALETWLRKAPPFKLKEGTNVPVHGGFVLSVKSLPLVWVS